VVVDTVVPAPEVVVVVVDFETSSAKQKAEAARTHAIVNRAVFILF
jgi:hypothetical protein